MKLKVLFVIIKNMDTAKLDIVYFVKESPSNEELRISLRSVAQNMPHKRVWIFGGCPRGITPDIRVKVKQEGITKWDRVRNMFQMACENKELTDDFIMFNDDFFVMRPTDHLDVNYRTSLPKHIEMLEANFGNKPSAYTRLLRRSLSELQRLGLPTLSYELHIPFIFNKEKMLKMMKAHPDWRSTRTMYGNLYNIGGERMCDVKIFSSKTELDYKNLQFLSTDDSVVNVNNDIWRYIRNQFKHKCEYED